MQSIIICEGSTDYVLLQYFMRKVNGWNDSKKKNFQGDPHFTKARTLIKQDNSLTIAGAGGCNKVLNGFSRVLETNSYASNDEESYRKIAIIVDRDEIDTEEKFIKDLSETLDLYDIDVKDAITHNEWNSCTYSNGKGKPAELSLLVLIIPFETTGALETFLLNSVSKKDEYDAEVITKGNSFVDNVDEEKRYLNKRRYITKAKFDVYFSVRTAAEQFNERQNILKNIDWENYEEIQTSFKKLSEL